MRRRRCGRILNEDQLLIDLIQLFFQLLKNVFVFDQFRLQQRCLLEEIVLFARIRRALRVVLVGIGKALINVFI